MNPNAGQTEEVVETVAPQALDQTVTREQREQLKALSTEIFGKSSRYKKLYEYDETLTKTVTETVPGENGEPDKTETKEVPLLFNGVRQSRRRYRSTAEVLQVMIEFKAKREEFLAKMNEQKELQAKAKAEAEAAKKLQEDLGGSAL